MSCIFGMVSCGGSGGDSNASVNVDLSVSGNVANYSIETLKSHFIALADEQYQGETNLADITMDRIKTVSSVFVGELDTQITYAPRYGSINAN